jgi:hypothetical protein
MKMTFYSWVKNGPVHTSASCIRILSDLYVYLYLFLSLGDLEARQGKINRAPFASHCCEFID